MGPVLFILHEDTLLHLDKQGCRAIGSKQMLISKILPAPDKKDKFQMLKDSGSSDVAPRRSLSKKL